MLMSGCCPEAEPDECTDCTGAMPNYLSITLSGAADADPVTCHWCDCVNATIGYLKVSCAWAPEQWAHCYGGYLYNTPITSKWRCWIGREDWLNPLAGGHYYLYLSVYYGTGYQLMHLWRADLGETKPSCNIGTVTNFVAHTPTLSFPYSWYTDTRCDLSAVSISATIAASSPASPVPAWGCEDCGWTFPEHLSLTIADMEDGDPLDGCDCADYNGSYVLTKAVSSPYRANYTLTVTPPKCLTSNPSTAVSAYISILEDRSVITVGFSIDTDVVYGSTTFSGPAIDCTAIDINWNDGDLFGNGSTNGCNWHPPYTTHVVGTARLLAV